MNYLHSVTVTVNSTKHSPQAGKQQLLSVSFPPLIHSIQRCLSLTKEHISRHQPPWASIFYHCCCCRVGLSSTHLLTFWMTYFLFFPFFSGIEALFIGKKVFEVLFMPENEKGGRERKRKKEYEGLPKNIEYIFLNKQATGM